eukprot:3691768-Lingulodinium_polyedra.AAC.1
MPLGRGEGDHAGRCQQREGASLMAGVALIGEEQPATFAVDLYFEWVLPTASVCKQCSPKNSISPN